MIKGKEWPEGFESVTYLLSHEYVYTQIPFSNQIETTTEEPKWMDHLEEYWPIYAVRGGSLVTITSLSVIVLLCCHKSIRVILAYIRIGKRNNRNNR